MISRLNACRLRLTWKITSRRLFSTTGTTRQPNLHDFLPKSSVKIGSATVPPYLTDSALDGDGQKVYFDVYGCQMNVNDTEIARGVLVKHGYQLTNDLNDANIALVMTCAIREGAEEKVWKRLVALARKKRKTGLKIGLLGCMAERLKAAVLERQPAVDLIAGPDAYLDLPRLLANSANRNTAVNVMLSADETYADVTPVRLDPSSVTAFVSIMRGCDNMCSFCIVPYTRGRERSRPIDSVVDEVRKLRDSVGATGQALQGVREVTLLGQNVNSYVDLSSSDHYYLPSSSEATNTVTGFSTVYKPKRGGRRFADLLAAVARIDPNLRVRFTSPHPKDFPDELLDVISSNANVCKQLHLPAQSGNTDVLERMNRGYTREAYLQLIEHVKRRIPTVALTTDIIAGFCGETEEAHRETLSLLDEVEYSMVYCFPYSMRAKTRAHRRLVDDVPLDVKRRRTAEIAAVARAGMLRHNQRLVGTRQLALVEKTSRRSDNDFEGRTCGGTKVIFSRSCSMTDGYTSESLVTAKPRDYVDVVITGASSQVFHGTPVTRTTVVDFNPSHSDHDCSISGMSVA